MRWKTKLLIPTLVSLGYLISSFFVKIVPCKVFPNILNPTYSWSFCNLNPDKLSLFGMQEKYWGISSQLTDAYLLSLGIFFICTFIFLMLFSHKKSHSKDKKEGERGFEKY